MEIKEADKAFIKQWLELRVALWPQCPPPDSEKEIHALLKSSRETAFIALNKNGRICGFAEVSLREYVDGCKSHPVGYLEGIYVLPEFRKCGIAKRLIQAGENWAIGRGCIEFGSDTALDNEGSIAFHQSIGFRETDRQVVFLKDIKQ